MCETNSNANGFSPDLFSPLQFCEVVDDGLQHLVQIKTSNSSHLHASTLCNSQLPANIQDNQRAAGKEMLPEKQLMCTTPNLPNYSVNSMAQQTPCDTKMIFSESNSPLIPMSAIHSSQDTVFVTSISKPHEHNLVQNSVVQGPLVGVMTQAFTTGNDTIVNMSKPESIALIQTSMPLTQIKNHSTMNRGVQTDDSAQEDEPEIIFTASVTSSFQSVKNVNNQGTSTVSQTNKANDAIPVKRTWRRPWKAKKDREKKNPPKKMRRVKRRKVLNSRKAAVRIDLKNGPPVDTSVKTVERKAEENIDQMKQKRQRIKLNRNSGREYVNRLGKVVGARKIGQPCNCPLKCWERMGTKVLDIFNNFWDLCDFNLQNSYLFTCLKLCDVKRRYTKRPAEESRRQNTFEYFVRICGKHLRVCKKAFMSSHGLTSDKRLRTLFCQMKDGALIPEPDKRGKHFRPNKSSNKSNQNTVKKKETPLQPQELNKCTKSKVKTKKKIPNTRVDNYKGSMFTQGHPVTHIDTTPVVATNIQEAPHTYIPNGEIYFPSHYLEPPQMTHHMNPIPSCQKMLEAPAYFMAGMKENTFHQ